MIIFAFRKTVAWRIKSNQITQRNYRCYNKSWVYSGNQPSGANLDQVLDQRTVVNYVTRLLGGKPVQILEWTVDSLEFRSYAESTQNILTVSGVARLRKKRRRWRILVKCLRKPPNAGPNSGWDREVTAYERLPRCILSNKFIRSPKFLGADKPTRNTARLWLEYVNGKPAMSWSLVDWQRMASNLAMVQADSAEKGSLLSEIWLNHDDLRKWVELDRARLFPVRLTSSLRRLVAPFLEPRALMTVAALWRERNELLDRLDSIPKTLCHNDIWSGNAVLEQRRSNQAPQRPVIFDWQLVGPGPIGSDLAFAVVAGVWLLAFSGNRIGQLERALLSGYMAGLRKAGKAEFVSHARESFAITAAMRYGFMLPQFLADIVDPTRMSEVIARNGSEPALVLANRAKLIMAGSRWAATCGIS